MTGPEQSHAHEEYDELAVGWALGALEPDDESRFTRHLEDCLRCQQTVDDAHDVSAALALALPVEQPSAGLKARIMTAVSAEPRPVQRQSEPAAPSTGALERRSSGNRPGGHRITQRPARGWTNRRGMGARGLALAAALALVAGLGVWNVTLRSQQDEAKSTVTAQAAVIDALDDRGVYRIAPLRTGEGARVGMVVVHDGAAQVMAKGLPLNDVTDETFVLWGLGPEAAPQALGTFDVVSPELDVRTVSSIATGFDQYDGYAISLEPGRSAPSTPTGMVATGTVGS